MSTTETAVITRRFRYSSPSAINKLGLCLAHSEKFGSYIIPPTQLMHQAISDAAGRK